LKNNLIKYLFVILFVLNGYAQEVYHRNIDALVGLPSNCVYDIMQDDQGYMWFATNEGVVRFDGRNFKEFLSKKINSKVGSLLKKDDFGRIWYETFDGYLNYIYKDSLHQLKQEKHGGFINYILNKNQLFYTTETGIAHVNLKNLQLLSTTKADIANTCFINLETNIVQLFNNYLRITEIKHLKLFENLPFLTKKIVAPIFTKSDALYCTDKTNTDKNMYKITAGKIESIFNLQVNNTIQNLYFLENKFWICTNKGIIVLDKNGKKLFDKVFFESSSITSICVDKDKKYWIGTLNDGVFKVSDFNEIETDLKNLKPLLLSKYKSDLLIGTEAGLICSADSNSSNEKEALFKSKNQILYINTEHPKFNFISSDGYYITDKKFNVLHHETAALKSIDFISENEAIYAVSGEIGLLKINDFYQKSSLKNLTFSLKHLVIKANLRGKIAIWNDVNKEALYLTSLGLFSYKKNRLLEIKIPDFSIKNIKKANGKIYMLSSSNQLFSYNNFVLTKINHELTKINLFKVINNQLYLGNKNEIYTLIKNKIQIINEINTAENIDDLEVSTAYYYALINKKLVRFIKKQQVATTTIDKLYIEKIFINNVDYTDESLDDLDFFKNNVTIQLSQIDFEAKNSIYYRINNNPWKEILSKGNTLQLLELSPNEYKIEFTSHPNNAVLTSVSFTIHKPYWESFWFQILISTLMISLGIAVYYKRLNQITQKNDLIIEKLKLENYLNESKMKLIKAQMNPHFFFNALNTIQSYIATNETEEATDYLNKFSKLTRMILEMTDKNCITID
jgi:hypothetical protein